MQSLWQPLTLVAFLAGIGAFCRWAGILNDEGLRQLSRLVLQVTLPVMLFNTAAQNDLTGLLAQGPWALLAGILVPFLGYAVGMVVASLFRLSPAQARVVRVNAAMSNTAFVGIPVCTALFGAQGGLLAALYDQGFNIPLFTLAPMGYSQSSARFPWREIVRAPMMWGLVLGILWGALGWGLPAWLAPPLNLLGGMNLPLALLVVGALARPEVKANMWRPLLAYLFSRLLLVPLVVLTLIWLSGLHGTGAAVIVLQSAMPASLVATVMAKEYSTEANLAATGAFLSIVLSLLTIPVIATVLAAL